MLYSGQTAQHLNRWELHQLKMMTLPSDGNEISWPSPLASPKIPWPSPYTTLDSDENDSANSSEPFDNWWFENL